LRPITNLAFSGLRTVKMGIPLREMPISSSIALRRKSRGKRKTKTTLNV
jgi:hypothetical protein